MQPDNDEEGFVARLTAWDDEVAEGKTSAPADPRESSRFASACHVLKRLESIWPRAKAERPPELPAGFSRFRILRVLGAGGFGIVYLAEDSRLKRQVALKMPRPESLVTSTWRERFMREARAVAQLNHPNIVPIFDSGEVGSWCFLVSAYCSGGSLGDWLKRQETLLPFKTAAQVIANLADAVHHAHQRGILHRDLKPGNILLTPIADTSEALPGFPFVPHVADFGLAKVLQQPDSAEADATLTRSTAILGTPAYMSPEQARGNGEPLDRQADVYALGVLLYELLSGQPPFRGASHLETLQQIASQDPLPPVQHRPGAPRDLEAICLKCLEKSPGRRYASAADLAEDLRRFLGNRPTSARPLGPVGRAAKSMRRHPALTGLSAVVATILLIIVGGLLWRSHELELHNEDLKAAAAREANLATKARLAQTLAEERERRVRLQTYATNLNIADTFARENRKELAHEILERQRPLPGHADDRDFAWRYLWHRCEFRITRKTTGTAIVLAFTRDGESLYVGDDYTTLECCDVATRKGTWVRQATPDMPYPLRWQFSPSAERVSIVSAFGQETRLAIFDSASNRQLYRDAIKAAGNPASSFSPDGALWAFADSEAPEDARVSLIDVKSGTKSTLLKKTGYRPLVLAFSPDGASLAVVFGVADGASDLPACLFAVYTFKTGKTVYVPPSDGFRNAGALHWSPDGKWLACPSQTHNVEVWATEPLRSHRVLPLKTFAPANLAFSPDSKHLAVVDSSAQPESQLVRTFRIEDGRQTPTTFGAKSAIHCLAWSPTDGRLAIAGKEKDIHLWNPLAAPSIRVFPGHQPAEAWGVAFSSDSKTLASVGDDHVTRFWDPYTGESLGHKNGHASLVTCVAYSPDGRLIATGGYDKVVVVRSATPPHQELHRFKHPYRIRCLAISADSKFLAAGSGDKGDVAVRLWDLDTGKEAGILAGHKNVVRSLAFAPQGNVLATASNDGTVCLWDPIRSKLLRTLPHKVQVCSLAFSPDGRMLVTGELNGALTFWNVADGRAITKLQHHTECVRSLAFSPDGRTLASGSQDKSVRMWNPEVQQELFVFSTLAHEVNSVAFSPDGAYLAAGLHDGNIALWHAPRWRR